LKKGASKKNKNQDLFLAGVQQTPVNQQYLYENQYFHGDNEDEEY
jgi:hypothetical protein